MQVLLIAGWPSGTRRYAQSRLSHAIPILAMLPQHLHQLRTLVLPPALRECVVQGGLMAAMQGRGVSVTFANDLQL